MLRNNQGNILKIVHETGCSLQIAEEALAKSNNWSDAIKYAKGTND